MSARTTTIGNLAIFKTSRNGIWVVRDKAARRDVAHVTTKAEALAIARAS